MSKRPYRQGYYRQGQEAGGCLRGFVYMLVIHPAKWIYAKLRGKPAPEYPDWIQKDMGIK